MDRADVIVVGAGIVGLSAARALAGAGVRVLVVDRGRPGAEASAAAAGWLAAQAEAEEGSPLLDAALRARDRHLGLAAELREETGIDVELSPRGTLELAFTDEEERALARRLAWQRARGLAVEKLGPDEVRGAEPNVNPAVRGAIALPEDRSVDNVRLTRALAASAVARGAALLTDRPVATLIVENGRVAGVKVGLMAAGAKSAALESPGRESAGMESRERESVGMESRGPESAGGESGYQIVSAPVVIEAMGAWSAALGGDPEPPPVEPVRGQILAFDVAADTLRHVVCTARGYVVPRAGGRLLAGSTLERAGFDKSVTLAGVRTVREIAAEIAPMLAGVAVAESWAGLRPGTPDGLPVIGPGALPGLIHATGLYRSGILLGPLVGEAVARLALGKPPAIDLAPFSPARFRRRT